MRARAVLFTSLVTLVAASAVYAATRGAANLPFPARDVRVVTSPALPVLGVLPELSGGTHWINSAPVTKADLRGRVALIEVWTYGCYNCLNALPHIVATAAKYKSAGLVTLGVHTPEFDREKVVANVERRVRELGVTFPVVMDNDFAIWRAFDNRFWPSVYLIDKHGRIRFHHDGEGRYAEIDAAVRALLAE
jgi:thiol-disulfide isomerase/thioredoxin